MTPIRRACFPLKSVACIKLYTKGSKIVTHNRRGFDENTYVATTTESLVMTKRLQSVSTIELLQILSFNQVCETRMILDELILTKQRKEGNLLRKELKFKVQSLACLYVKGPKKLREMITKLGITASWSVYGI